MQLLTFFTCLQILILHPRKLSSSVSISSFQFSLTANTCAVRFSNLLSKRVGVNTFPLCPMPTVFPCTCSVSIYLHHSQRDSYPQSPLSVDIYLTPHTLPYSVFLCVNTVHTIHSSLLTFIHISVTLQRQLEGDLNSWE